MSASGKYILNIFLYTIPWLIIAVLIKYLVSNQWTPGIVWSLFPLFIAVNILSHLMILKYSQVRFQKFVSIFMLSTSLKLFIYLTILIAYVFFHRSEAVPFISWVFCLYLVYTLFDVVSLLRHLNQSKE